MTNKKSKASVSKARALSLHIGLNTVSPSAYGGWDGPLAACEFDANDLAALARAQGMKAKILLTKKGTRANTLAEQAAGAQYDIAREKATNDIRIRFAKKALEVSEAELRRSSALFRRLYEIQFHRESA